MTEINQLYQNRIDNYNELIAEEKKLNRLFVKASAHGYESYEIKLENIKKNVEWAFNGLKQYERIHEDEFGEQNTTSFYQNTVRYSDVIEQTKNKQALRDSECTKLILKKMELNKNIQMMEDALSNDIAYWQKLAVPFPDTHDTSYVFWFCLEQGKFYRTFVKQLINANTRKGVKEKLDTLSQRHILLRQLTPEDDDFYLSEALDDLMNASRNYIYGYAFMKDSTLIPQQSLLKSRIDNLVRALFKASNEAISYAEAGGKVEFNKKQAEN